MEGLANDVDLFGRLQSDLQDIVFRNRDKSRAIAELGLGGWASVCGGHVGDQGAGNADGCGGP